MVRFSSWLKQSKFAGWFVFGAHIKSEDAVISPVFFLSFPFFDDPPPRLERKLTSCLKIYRFHPPSSWSVISRNFTPISTKTKHYSHFGFPVKDNGRLTNRISSGDTTEISICSGVLDWTEGPVHSPVLNPARIWGGEEAEAACCVYSVLSTVIIFYSVHQMGNATQFYLFQQFPLCTDIIQVLVLQSEIVYLGS